jgi:hypothetical protein
MTASTTVIPHTIDDDNDDVQCALVVARASHQRGQLDDALKWLRRAAQMAADHDTLSRAIQLSKAAAEIAAKLDRSAPPLQPSLRPIGTPQEVSRPAPPPSQPSTAPGSDRSLDDNRLRRSADVRAERERAGREKREQRRQEAEQRRNVARSAWAERRAQRDSQPTHSDLEQTQPRLVVPSEAERKQTPPPEFELRDMFEDDLDEPTPVRMANENDDFAATCVQIAQPPSDPFALDRVIGEDTVRERAVRENVSDDEPSHDRLSDCDYNPLLEDEDSDTQRVPMVAAAALSTTRIAVIPGARGGRPEMVFLPPGAAPPQGAAIAMIVPASLDDASRLAAMLRVLQHTG